MMGKFLLMISLFGGVALAQEMQQPAAGSPLRKAILDGLRADEPVARLQKEWQGKVVFTHVVIRSANDWAWVVASPQTADAQHIIEPLTSVMHTQSGHWQVVEYISDEVAPADRPEQAYRNWREQFLRRHRECPRSIFPEKFD